MLRAGLNRGHVAAMISSSAWTTGPQTVNGRVGQPERSPCDLFLRTNQSSFMTVSLVVDGGATARLSTENICQIWLRLKKA